MGRSRAQSAVSATHCRLTSWHEHCARGLFSARLVSGGTQRCHESQTRGDPPGNSGVGGLAHHHWLHSRWTAWRDLRDTAQAVVCYPSGGSELFSREWVYPLCGRSAPSSRREEGNPGDQCSHPEARCPSCLCSRLGVGIRPRRTTGNARLAPACITAASVCTECSFRAHSACLRHRARTTSCADTSPRRFILERGPTGWSGTSGCPHSGHFPLRGHDGGRTRCGPLP